MRHSTTAVVKDLESMTDWKEYEVGTVAFWENLKLGVLAGCEDINGDYIGIITDFSNDLQEDGVIWVYLKPDPTQPSLPEGQTELPIAFSYRDKIWLETIA
jgi:hypothetical protein